MQVYCPRCEGRLEFSALDLGGSVGCECGASVRPGARAEMRLFRDKADEVCRMILTSEYPAIEIALERGRLRTVARSLFPDRMELYEMIYEKRFDRLWEQFRAAEDAA